MSMHHIDIDLDTEDLELLLDCLRREERRCKAISKREPRGFRVGEKEKLREWGYRAELVRSLESRIAENVI